MKPTSRQNDGALVGGEGVVEQTPKVPREHSQLRPMAVTIETAVYP
jgi:hypothetical protein